MKANLVESRSKQLLLSEKSARALVAVGRAFASRKSWFGASPTADQLPRTVLTCIPSQDGYDVKVDDCVGAVGVEEVQLTIDPKIPLRHFIYLLQNTGDLPRFGEERVWLSGEWTLVDLLCAWFLNAAETLLRRGLLRDYVETRNQLTMPRGRIDAIGTATEFYAGRMRFDCEYDTFSEDIAINRVVLAAAQVIRRNAVVHADLRRRARRIAFRLDGIGPLQEHDLFVEVDRRTRSYQSALLLAKAILRSEARSIECGELVGWAFLIPTPVLIESAIRRIIEIRLPEVEVRKRGLTLSNGSMTVNPDLVFPRHDAVGDVKYKHLRDGWPRPDLYQSVAFASAFRSRKACVISFNRSTFTPLPEARFGDIAVAHIGWNEELENPKESENDFIADLAFWLGEPLVKALDAPGLGITSVA